MTNLEKIKSMSIDEMIDFMEKVESQDIDYAITFCNLCDGEYDCSDDCMRHWLESEVKE